ncbi:hypothetical protein CsSME_00043410 [Camellia sinensis var. sinensis]
MAGIFALLTMLFLASLRTEASVHVLALYLFEDAIVDGGNTQPTPPHGIDLNTTIPIHWTNGKIIVDFIGKLWILFIIALSLSLSLSLSLMVLYAMIPEISSYTSGVEISKIDVNYRHVGCGLFSVFLVSFGINDYSPNYLSSGVVSKMAPQEFAKILLNEMSMGLNTLYRLGARKFVVKNIWPLGRTPNFVNPTLGQFLAMKLSTTFSHSDDFLFVIDLMQNSGKYGYEKLLLNYDI